MSDSRPIGIFDSGFGGLTAVKEIIRALPDEQIVYFGDTARVPYGPKSRETVIRFSIENILFLLKYKVKLIVIACNTASSVALPIVEENFKVPIIGVISPGVCEAVRVTKSKNIGVIGTRTTINSKTYEKMIKQKSPGAKVYSVECPLFVPLVEEGWTNTRITKLIAREYLLPLKRKKIDTIVLGCTHYPLLKPVIQEVLGRGVTLVDSARQVAQQAKEIIIQQKMLAPKKKVGNRLQFYVSDEPDNFARLGKRFLGFALKNVRKVSNV